MNSSESGLTPHKGRAALDVPATHKWGGGGGGDVALRSDDSSLGDNGTINRRKRMPLLSALE